MKTFNVKWTKTLEVNLKTRTFPVKELMSVMAGARVPETANERNRTLPGSKRII
jgi:hypothetical protein